MMSSSALGNSTSTVEVTHISGHGIWILAREKELFMPYDNFPWFKDQPVKVILNIEEPSPGHFYWPDIDVDLSTLGHKYTHVQSVSKVPMQGALRREWRALFKKRNAAVALWRRSLLAGRKSPSPALRSLELTGPVLRSRALAIGFSDPAERVCIYAQGYLARR